MASRSGRGRRRFRPARGSGSKGCSTRCRRGASSCASPRAEYAACLDAVKRLAMARSDVGFTLEHDGRRILTLQPAEAAGARRRAADARARPSRRSASTARATGLRLTGVISLPTFNRGMADQQYLFVNSRPVKDRLLVGALRAAYRDLIARDRHPIAALVPRGSARGGRRQRPPGQDRGPLPRSRGGSRADRRRPAPCARRRKPAQRRARAGRGAGDVDDERELSSPRARPSALGLLEPARAVAATACSRRRCSTFAPAGARRARGRAGAELSRSASRAGRSPRPTSSPKPRTGWSSSTSMPRTSGWCSSGCARRAKAGAVARQALLMPEVVELDEPDCDRLEGAAGRACRHGP